MKHELFDIWESEAPWLLDFPWRVQLVNYIGQFANRERAEQFVESTKKARVQAAKSAVKSK